MASINNTAILPTTRSISRGNLLGRLGAVVIAAAAVNVLATQKAAVAHAPACCSGAHGCNEFGCGCPGRNIGECCWYCTSSTSCRIYQCCDNYCGANFCICSYLLCNCC